MDIVCPKCSTEYEFDDARVPASGVAVKCTTCEHTFKVHRPPAAAPPGGAQASRSWMIRTAAGALLKFQELTTLQQWIVERKVTRDDQISRVGDTWKRLGDIAELSSFFQVMDAAATPRASDAEEEPLNKGEGPSELSRFGRAGAEPAFAASASQLAVVGSTAAWEDGGARFAGGDSDAGEGPAPRRDWGRFVLIAVVLLVAGCAVAFALSRPKFFRHVFASLFSKHEVSKAYRSGREAFLRDDLESLKLAEQQLAAAPKESVLARAARGEVFARWSQRLKDEAELMEREARLLEAQASVTRAGAQAGEAKGPNPRRHRLNKKEREAADKAAVVAQQLVERAKSLRQEASKSRVDAAQKLQLAQTHIDAAVAEKSDRAEVYRAEADLHRLLGKGDVLALIAQARRTAPQDPETFYVEGLYALDKNEGSRAVELLKTAILKTKAYSRQILLRAAFQLGMIHLRAGRLSEARQQVDAILAANAKHQLSRRLLETIAAEQALPATLKPGLAASPAAAAAAAAPVTPPPVAPPAASPAAAVAVAPKAPTAVAAPPKAVAPAARVAHHPAAPKPTSYAALVKAGYKAAEYGHSGKALDYYEAALKLNPSGVEAIVGIGYCELDVQHFSGALVRFRKALNLIPSNGDAMLGMAATYKALGNAQKALDYYQAFIRTHPSSGKVHQARRNAKELAAKLGKSLSTEPAAPKAPEPAPPKAPEATAPKAPEATVPKAPEATAPKALGPAAPKDSEAAAPKAPAATAS